MNKEKTKRRKEMNLTQSQKRIYVVIKDFINKNGYSPTVREIGSIAGISSPGTIHGHLKRIKDKGFITFKEGKNRTIRIIKEV
jgi:repressor LexA